VRVSTEVTFFWYVAICSDFYNQVVELLLPRDTRDKGRIEQMQTQDVIIKVVKLDSSAKLPQFAHEEDAGMDLFSIEEKVIMPGDSALIRTGIKVELPPYTEAQIRPRSGLALKNSITVLNTPGTIDQGYRGEIRIILINHGKNEFVVERQMKIAQMVVKPLLKVSVVEATDLTESDRSDGGFGSTG
jgi:deoxyuridine 5''-triphosphate nucleotidohydrolase (dut)